jgi:hypothetical protein
MSPLPSTCIWMVRQLIPNHAKFRPSWLWRILSYSGSPKLVYRLPTRTPTAVHQKVKHSEYWETSWTFVSMTQTRRPSTPGLPVAPFGASSFRVHHTFRCDHDVLTIVSK